ncbi:MAG: hypothetical protein JRJ65_13640 [Deltaproteobacteria bacterium]|nr:hypothetical protein [Deltaproteobacteria bacterium]
MSTKTEDFGLSLGTRKVLDARRQGATIEAYELYAAGRSDRRQRRPSALPFGCELRAERLRAMSLSNGR